MISSEVQRTIVKSPPELWAELSDPAALARHLGELGDIRITRVHPEEKVEWEAEDTSGIVAIKASGWGTKVTLTVTREVREPEPPIPVPPMTGPTIEEQPITVPPITGRTTSEQPITEPPTAPVTDATMQPGLQQATAPEPEPIDTESEPLAFVDTLPAKHTEPAQLLEAGPQDVDSVETDQAFERPAVTSYPEHEPRAEPTAESRRGLFARLFRRRRAVAAAETESPSVPPEPVAALVPLPVPPEPIAAFAPLPVPLEPIAAVEPVPVPPEPPAAVEPPPASPEPIAAVERVPVPPEPPAAVEPLPASPEPVAAEELATEQVKAVLTSMLDRLGAAHHRPFSRA
jgi:hypothetical protein